MLIARRKTRMTVTISRTVVRFCRGDDDFLEVKARAFRTRSLAIFPETWDEPGKNGNSTNSRKRKE